MKKCIAMFLACMMGVSLMACGGSSTSTSAPSEPAAKTEEAVAEEAVAEEAAAEEAVAEEAAAEEAVAEEAAADEAVAEEAAADEAQTAEIIDFPAKPVIGIAWRADTDNEFCTNVQRAVEEAGGTCVILGQVLSPDLTYDADGKLTEYVTDIGMLDEIGAKKVRSNTWHGSNAEEVLKNVSFVFFTGGEDVSPNLYYTPEPWHGIEEEIDYNAERDVSDYLTMTYCLDNDIPLMGFCRGMQMLSIVSGGEVIQDIPTYFASLNKEYNFEHRNEKATPESYRDYSPHDVVVEKDSILYQIVGTELMPNCPSWHHQCIKNVDNTRLAVTGYKETNGEKIVEAVERTDKTFAVGLQFHPEAAIVKRLDNAENKDNFIDNDMALSIFRWIVEEGYEVLENAA